MSRLPNVILRLLDLSDRLRTAAKANFSETEIATDMEGAREMQQGSMRAATRDRSRPLRVKVRCSSDVSVWEAGGGARVDDVRCRGALNRCFARTICRPLIQIESQAKQGLRYKASAMCRASRAVDSSWSDTPAGCQLQGPQDTRTAPSPPHF